MKRMLLSILILLITTGCVAIKDASIDDLINTTLKSEYSLYNHVNRGFKYYLPRVLSSTIKNDLNEIITSKYYDYYLYVDLVSYSNNVKQQFQVKDGIYFSKILENKDGIGYLNITNIDADQYIIDVYFNYAKIEVKVKEKDLNETVTNCLVILSSIQYNDDVIKSMMSDDLLSSAEEQINIFEGISNDVDILDVDEEDIYTGNEEEDYDPDVIN